MKLLPNIDWKKLYKPLVYSTFGIYCFLLVWMVIFKCTLPNVFSLDFMSKPVAYRFERGIVPFSYSFYTFQALDMILNIVAFVPMGIYLPFMLKRRYAFPIIAVVSVTFELIQLLTGFGWFDTLDIITNIAGGYIGIGIYTLLRPRIKDEIINKVNLYCTIIFGIIAIAVLIYIPIYFTIGDPFNENKVNY